MARAIFVSLRSPLDCLLPLLLPRVVTIRETRHESVSLGDMCCLHNFCPGETGLGKTNVCGQCA